MYLYLVIALLLGLFTFHIVTRYGYAGRLLSNIPAAKPTFPIIGSLLIFTKADSISLWNIYRELHKKYYPIVKLWSLTYPTVLIWDPDDVKIMLTDKDNIDKAYPYKHLQYAAGTGLIAVGGEKWVQRRKLLNPAFHIDILKKYLDVTNFYIKEFLENMCSHDSDTVINVSSTLSKLVITITTETSLGVSPEFVENEFEYYEGLVRRVFDIVIYRNVRPFIPDWLFQFMTLGRQQKVLANEIYDFTTKLIDERRQFHESTNYKFIEIENDNELSESRNKFATLDHLLSMERKGLIDKSGTLEEIINFTAAAHDTTAKTLIFTLLMLAENEHLQTIARNEASKVISRCNGVFTVDNLKDLEFIDRCVKETLRLFPPAHMFGRTITKDLHLKNHVIPAGTDLMVTIFDIQRDERFWKDSLKFDPDRFLPEQVENHYPYSYIPYSAGPRNCIGRKLAQFTLKTMVANILYNYKLESVTKSEEIKYKLSIVLTPSEPIYIRFIKL